MQVKWYNHPQKWYNDSKTSKNEKFKKKQRLSKKSLKISQKLSKIFFKKQTNTKCTLQFSKKVVRYIYHHKIQQLIIC